MTKYKNIYYYQSSHLEDEFLHSIELILHQQKKLFFDTNILLEHEIFFKLRLKFFDRQTKVYHFWSREITIRTVGAQVMN